MISYLKNELVSATSITRHFGDLLSKLRSQQLKRIAVIRNNSMEAIILPVEEYERLAEAASLREHRDIYSTVSKRRRTPRSRFVPFKEAVKRS
ncbi:MAG: prevent-host-death protein [Spirochaetota bacterium]